MTIIYILERNNIPFYIGKTKNFINRKKRHENLHGDIIVSIIDECEDDKQIWKPLECYWIEQFKAWGFKLINKNNGGGGPEFLSDETKKRMSNSKIGKLPPFTGKHHSEESKNKIRNNKNRNLKLKNREVNWNKPIIQYDLNMNHIREWNSAQEAYSIIKRGDINACLKGRTNKAGGYKWKYKEV